METFQAEKTLDSKAPKLKQDEVGGGSGNSVPVEPRLKMRLDPKESGHRQSVDLILRAVGSLEGKERFPRL